METFKVAFCSVGVEMDEEPRHMHILFTLAYVPNKSNAVALLIVFQKLNCYKDPELYQFLSLLNGIDSVKLMSSGWMKIQFCKL